MQPHSRTRPPDPPGGGGLSWRERVRTETSLRYSRDHKCSGLPRHQVASHLATAHPREPQSCVYETLLSFKFTQAPVQMGLILNLASLGVPGVSFPRVQGFGAPGPGGFMSGENPMPLLFIYFFPIYKVLCAHYINFGKRRMIQRKKNLFYLKFYSLPRKSLYSPCHVFPSFRYLFYRKVSSSHCTFYLT